MRLRLIAGAVVLLGASAARVAPTNPVRKLTVSGGKVAGTLEITDPATLALSDVLRGVFLDPVGGVARAPGGLPQYVVSFYLPEDHVNLWRRVFGPRRLRRAYVVRLALDTAARSGYVYVPGDGDAWAAWNRATVVRPAQEGRWSRAASAWTARLATAIERAHVRPQPQCPRNPAALIAASDSTFRDVEELRAVLDAAGVRVLCAYHSTLDGMAGRPTVGVLTTLGPSAVAFFPSASAAGAARLRGYVRDGVEIAAIRTPASGAREWTFAESDPSDFVVRGRWLFATFGQTDLQSAIRGALDNVR